MKVRAIKPFRDLEEGVERKEGEQWDVTEERYEHINSVYSFPLVEKVSPRRGRKKAEE